MLSTDILDNVNPDLSDSEFLEREDEPIDAATPAPSDMGEAPTPRYEDGDEDEEEEEEDPEEDNDIDEELAAELEGALGDEEEDDDDDDDDDESEEESEDEDDEEGQARKLINEEIRDLEAAVAKKDKEIASSANPLIRAGLSLLIFACTKLTAR
jgi:transcription initiation factor TFIID subunit 7